MPLVTVPERPSGAPRATTGWPTFSADDEPKGMTGSEPVLSIFSTARSVSGSRPTMCAGFVVPSFVTTSTVPPFAADEMT